MPILYSFKEQNISIDLLKYVTYNISNLTHSQDFHM